MQIQKVKINNFYSFKEAEIDFSNYNGVVRITGINKDSAGSNGAGKSTIFEAITWGIFGKTIRKSTEDALVNFKYNTNCFVELELHKNGVGDIKIYRSKRPTSLTLMINGEAHTKANATETQKYIEQIIESDYKSFLAAIVFGQHSDTSFLECSPEEKRAIIRNCFNLDDLFSKRNAVKEIKSAVTAEMKVFDALQKSTQEEMLKVEKLLPGNKYKLVDLPPLDDVLEAERKISERKTKVLSANNEISKLKKDIQKLNQTISKGVYEENSECPICKSDYTTSQSGEQLKEAIENRKDLSAALEDLNFKVQTMLQEVEDLKPKYTSSEWAKYNEKNNLIKQSEYHVNRYNELKEKNTEQQEKLKALDQKLEIMKFWEKAFSEQGMIKYLIRNILDYFNLKCNEFLSILSVGQFKISFSDELIETISNNGAETKYISLSGGEKRKVNLAIMLALQDLSSKISKIDCNLIFFDEVSDNIDDLGIEAVYNLLNTLRNQYTNKVILLITHNNHLSSLFSESQEITVVKNKGISKIYGNQATK